MHEKNGDDPVFFQVSFYTNAKDLKKFKRVTLPQAQLCPVPKKLRGKKYLVGFRCDVKRDHPYAVHQKIIVEFNNQPVIP